MKPLTEEELAHADHVARVGALKGAAIGAVIGTVGLAVAQQRSALVRGLSIPFKGFLLTASVVTSSMVVAEQSINKLKEDAHHANGEVVARKAAPHQSVLNYIAQHRYYVLGGVWASMMAGALAVSFSQPNLKFSQKLIHARMYAQFGTIAALLGTAALSQLDDGSSEVPQVAAANRKY